MLVNVDYCFFSFSFGGGGGDGRDMCLYSFIDMMIFRVLESCLLKPGKNLMVQMMSYRYRNPLNLLDKMSQNSFKFHQALSPFYRVFSRHKLLSIVHRYSVVYSSTRVQEYKQEVM